jgi:lipopolysaccharide biosynthesis glycosyltransferase
MKPLTIVVASDNHYIVMLAALIKSIEAHISKNQKINFEITWLS